MTGEWLPIPEALLRAVGWAEGDDIAIEVVEDTVLLTKVPAAERDTARLAPSKGRQISKEGAA